MTGGGIYGCAVEFTLDVLGGKWRTVILARLKQGAMRYGELRGAIPGLSDKVLTQRLHELADAGLIDCRREEGDRRYFITAEGASLGPALEALYAWGSTAAPRMGARVRGVTEAAR